MCLSAERPGRQKQLRLKINNGAICSLRASLDVRDQKDGQKIKGPRRAVMIQDLDETLRCPLAIYAPSVNRRQELSASDCAMLSKHGNELACIRVAEKLFILPNLN